MEKGIKIYGLCLERLRHQITNFKQKSQEAADGGGTVLLESFGSWDVEDIIDILEIEDLEEKNINTLTDKLAEIGYAVSALTGENISFEFTDEGHLGLYLTLNGDNEYLSENTIRNTTPLTYCMR